MRSSLLGDIECPMFVVTVQTLLLRGNVGVDDIARGMALACSVPPDVVMGRVALAAREYIGWVAAGLGNERKPAWWVD